MSDLAGMARGWRQQKTVLKGKHGGCVGGGNNLLTEEATRDGSARLKWRVS